MNDRRWAVLLVAAVAHFGGGCNRHDSNASQAKPATTGSERVLTIGGIMPLSGPVSTVGQAWMRGWELYWDKVNAEGGIQVADRKYHVNFVSADSRFDAESAGRSAKKLIYKDGATFVFGELTNAAADAIQVVSSKEKVLNVVPYLTIPGGDGDVSVGKPYVVRPFISTTDSIPLDYEYLRQQWPNAQRVAIAGWAGAEALVDRAVEIARQHHYEVVAKDAYSMDSQDFVPFFSKLLSSKPDVVELNSSPISGYLVRTMRQLGFQGPIFSDSPLDPLVIKDTAGDENSHDVFCNGMDPFSPTPEMKLVVDRWNKKYGDKFVTDAWLAWDTAWVVHQAMLKAESVDPPAVAAAFDKLTKPGDLMTVFGPGMMGGKGAYGVDRVLAKPIPISRIDNGKISLVKLALPVR